jgi:hypothetical protein
VKKFLNAISMILAILFVLSVVIGCESKPEVKKDDKGKNEKNSTVKLDLPDWFMSPPVDKEILYAVGYSKKQNLQNAINDASTSARAELSRIISVKVSTMTKQFMEEAGAGKDAQANDFSQSVTKTLANNVLSGTKIEKQDIKQTGESYSVAILVKLSLDDMAKMFAQATKVNAAAYNDLMKKVNKGFDELNKSVDNLEGKDFDKAKTPKVEE